MTEEQADSLMKEVFGFGLISAVNGPPSHSTVAVTIADLPKHACIFTQCRYDVLTFRSLNLRAQR